jgi:tetratricopeptide (TPR) repeat protein
MLTTQGHKPEARLQLAAYAAETGNPELAIHVYELAAIDNDELQFFITSLIQAKLQANDFIGAQNDIEALFLQKPNWLERQKPFLQSLRAISTYGLYRPDLGDIYLEEFSSAYATQPAMLLNTIKELRRIGVPEKAQQLLEIGLHTSPNHPELLAQIIELSIEKNSYEKLEDHIRRFLDLRRPNKEFSKRILSTIRLNPNLFAATTERNRLIRELRSIIQN